MQGIPGTWHMVHHVVQRACLWYKLRARTSTWYLVVSIWRRLIVGKIARMSSSWYGAKTQTMEQKLSDECLFNKVRYIGSHTDCCVYHTQTSKIRRQDQLDKITLFSVPKNYSSSTSTAVALLYLYYHLLIYQVYNSMRTPTSHIYICILVPG